MNFVDIALHLADSGFRVFPLQQGGKLPMVKGFSEVATTDPVSIVQTWAHNPNWNVGIATGSTNGIVVVDLDTAEAIAWWDSLGIPGGLRVRTPSGGLHIYYAIEPDVEIQTNRSKLHPGVDIRAEGGLVVAPGSRTFKGVYQVIDQPFTLSAIPDAPQELLDLLPRKQEYSTEEIDLTGVEPVEEATQQERKELDWIREDLDGLARPWREGAGWRESVFRNSCWLWRMVRSPFYAIDEDQAAALILQHAPSDHTWGQAQILEQWKDAQKRTHGQIAAAPVEARPPLLPWDGFPLDRAFPDINGESFASVWNSLPEKATPGALWGHRQKLLIAMLSKGFPEDLAATVVWHAKATKLPGINFGGHFIVDTDSRHIELDGLWKEVDQAKAKAEEGTGAAAEPAPAAERPSHAPTKKKHELLEGNERTLVAQADWWGSRAMTWAKGTFSMANMPYFRMNMWTVLSIVFSPYAKLPGEGGNDRPINLYVAIVGSTTSGKTEARRFIDNILKYMYGAVETPDIGGNFTPESLTETLITRDGMSSWLNIDEAHTKIAVWKKPVGPFSEMPGVVTAVYDGNVKAIYRATKKDISGKHATAFVTTHFMGTPQGMADVMDPTDWESGFLNRFLWTIGDAPRNSASAMVGGWLAEEDLDAADDGKESAGAKTYQQWAAEFHKAIHAIRRGEGETARIRLPRSVIDRHEKFVERLLEIAEDSPYYERLRPTFHRFQESIMRCAALVALSRGSIRIEPLDHLIALEQAEEWLRNLLIMVEATDESLRTREVNMIEKAVLENGGRMSVAAINRLPRFKNRRREVDDLISELSAQGRAERKTADGTELLILKGAVEA